MGVLRTVFGYGAFRGEQRQIVEHVVGGGDALVLMPTGGGKSLCYQIPALVRPGTGIVVSPLIALMQNQVDALLELGVRAAFLNSTQDWDTVKEVERRLCAGELDLLYVAPERLLTDRCLALFERVHIALFAIDEAHCVSQWGHDFRPEYSALSVLHERWPAVPRIALTATADAATRAEIIDKLAPACSCRVSIGPISAIASSKRTTRGASCSISSNRSTAAMPASSIACRAPRPRIRRSSW